ncbi:helix-turn-helix domain-containing protein (plasmid) [Streptomyces europaeiscabiei]|uniref:helix-turn-helix domain-containing protein n=1 Tax=Streptomyces europaeiscabiei TaxID=146819 RepID=UPI002E7FD353|nr:helix-turn-helix domain-containing protein [Streptomyces europaeiscabiei]WUD38839.1 helix-turn-helix domain-containing protein [Streptomyces europaeiscabiei]
MIPQGRQVRTEADVADALGIEVHVFRRKVRDEFEAKVPRVNPAEGRVRLYDAAQADAYAEGKPIPAAPDLTAEHPDDLLTDKEAANILDVTASTVRAYATSGYLPGGVDEHGRRWPRREILARLEAGDRREDPAHPTGRAASLPGRNQGRRGGAEAGPDPRAVEVAAELAAPDEDRPALTGAQIAARYGVSRTTGATILKAARTLNTSD